MTHVAEADKPGPVVTPPRPRRDLPALPVRLLRLVRAHPVFAALLAAGLALRVITMLGYRWSMWFNDAYEYVETAVTGGPHIVRPNGYVFLLQALEPFHSFALVTGLQHLMGLGTAVLIYALLRRRFGVRGWLAALATAPVLLDAYQIQLEHMILSDAWFIFLMTLLITLVLWWRDFTVARGALLGLLMGYIVLTRSVGLAVLLMLLVYLLTRRVGWRVLATTIVTCAIPLVAYAAWFDSAHGRFALSNSDGPFLYARVMKFADCEKIKPPVEEVHLCTSVPIDQRPSSQFYVWDTRRMSPLHRTPGDFFEKDKSTLAGDFAKRAVVAQPGDYLKAVGYDVIRVFRWDRQIFPNRYTYDMYQFRDKVEPLPDWAEPSLRAYGGNAAPKISDPFAGFMQLYQRYVYMRGTMLALVLLVAAVGMVRRWRQLGGHALLPFGVVAGLLVTPAASAEFDYRYVIPAVPMAFLAAIVAWRARPGDAPGEVAAAPERDPEAAAESGQEPERESEPGQEPGAAPEPSASDAGEAARSGLEPAR